MKAGRNYCLLQVEKEYENVSAVKGLGGKDILINTTYDPKRHARIYGTAIAAPDRALDGGQQGARIILFENHPGQPIPLAYHEPDSFWARDWKTIAEIIPEVEVGDRVYFHYDTLSDSNVRLMAEDEDGKTFYAVRYDEIFCVVRAGNIIPIGSHVLVTPDKEPWDSILVPTRNSDGSLKDKSLWLQTKVEPSEKYLLGWVAHVGTPYACDRRPAGNGGHSVELAPGDHIIYSVNSDFRATIEGKEYFVMKQRHILAKFT